MENIAMAEIPVGGSAASEYQKQSIFQPEMPSRYQVIIVPSTLWTIPGIQQAIFGSRLPYLARAPGNPRNMHSAPKAIAAAEAYKKMLKDPLVLRTVNNGLCCYLDGQDTLLPIYVYYWDASFAAGIWQAINQHPEQPSWIWEGEYGQIVGWEFYPPQTEDFVTTPTSSSLSLRVQVSSNPNNLKH